MEGAAEIEARAVGGMQQGAVAQPGRSFATLTTMVFGAAAAAFFATEGVCHVMLQVVGFHQI